MKPPLDLRRATPCGDDPEGTPAHVERVLGEMKSGQLDDVSGVSRG